MSYLRIHDQSKSAVSHPSTEAPQYSGFHLGYLTVFYFSEQLANALPATLQLYYFSEHYNWRLGLIEPFLAESKITLMPSLDKSRATPFSTYFDRGDFINHIQKCFKSSINLTSYADFLVKAARKFAYLRISKNEKNIRDTITECEIDLKPIEKRLNEHVNKVSDLARAEHGKDYLFSGWKAVCVNTDDAHPFYMNRIGPYIRRLITPSCKNTSEVCLPEVTLVLSQWRRVVQTKSHFFFTDPEYGDHKKYCQLSDLSPTSFIIDTAHQFFQSLSLKRPFIGIHLRTEKLQEKRITLDECMRQLNMSLFMAKDKYSIQQDSVIMIYDIREHGSNSVDKKRRDFAQDTVARIKQLTNVTIVEFKPTAMNITGFSGLVPLVEKEFLASADVLVAIGGGGFQGMIKKRFSELHPQGDKFTPCN